jgi:CDP-6-deoxy-D-xylo-4-hexulose-3-dehydrase
MQGREFRISGPLTGADRIMNDTFWIGLYPGLTEEMLAHTVRRLGDFLGFVDWVL